MGVLVVFAGEVEETWGEIRLGWEPYVVANLSPPPSDGQTGAE